MTDNVALLKRAPDPHVIARVKELLADAEAGTLQAFAIVSVNEDDSIRSGWVGEVPRLAMLGGITLLKDDYLTREFERE